MKFKNLTLLLSLIIAGVSILDGADPAGKVLRVPAVEQLRKEKQNNGLSSLQRVLLSHFESITFGTDTSYLVAGTYISNKLETELLIAGRSPGLLRVQFKKDKIEHLLIGKPGEFWSSFNQDDTAQRTESSRVLIQLEANYYLLYWGFEANGTAGLTLQQQAGLAGDYACYIIENRQLDGALILHYIDIETGVERRRVAQFGVDGEPDVYELTYHAYRPTAADGPQWPGGYTLTKNGAVNAEVSFDKIQVNPGVGTWMFEP